MRLQTWPFRLVSSLLEHFFYWIECFALKIAYALFKVPTIQPSFER